MITNNPCDPLAGSLHFVSGLAAPGGDRGPAYWFIFQGEKMLLGGDGAPSEVPSAVSPAAYGLAPVRSLYLGYLENEAGAQVDCYGAEIDAEAALPQGMTADGLRGVFPLIGDVLFGVAGRAVQLVSWDRTHRFCGQCGAATENMPHERAKHCPACGLTSYPRLSPATIIAVVRESAKGRQLLLARNHRFPAGRYSVVAGYVEPGETLEECAHREVCEEVGISIKNLRYFGSQPWPFPNSLMIAFTAEYGGGEIRLEESEIADAGWFTPSALPGLPPKMSVARRLIDWFVETSD